MTGTDKDLTNQKASSASDAEAIRHFETAVSDGKHWFIALLESIGLWTSAEETYNDRGYRYLIGEEAFDWLLLSERLCDTADGLLPQEEKNDLLFHASPPLGLSSEEVKQLIGDIKYKQYLNYFYGVTLEGMLQLATKDEVHKERYLPCPGRENNIDNEAFERIYGASKDDLLKSFRLEKGYARLKTITLYELKEFTYWLFKYRLKQCEKAKVASDTKKALDYLKRQWEDKGPFGTLVKTEPG